jgi:hypothetical protein
VLGVLTQIDNMTYGLSELCAELAALRAQEPAAPLNYDLVNLPANNDYTPTNALDGLQSIILYGTDTLSGRLVSDGLPDAAWYAEAVREMVRRARLTRKHLSAQPAADAQALRDAAVLARTALREAWCLIGPGSSSSGAIAKALNALDAALGTDRSEAPK